MIEWDEGDSGTRMQPLMDMTMANSPYKKGDRVELHGLAAAQHNGKFGTVLSQTEERAEVLTPHPVPHPAPPAATSAVLPTPSILLLQQHGQRVRSALACSSPCEQHLTRTRLHSCRDGRCYSRGTRGLGCLLSLQTSGRRKKGLHSWGHARCALGAVASRRFRARTSSAQGANASCTARPGARSSTGKRTRRCAASLWERGRTISSR